MNCTVKKLIETLKESKLFRRRQETKEHHEQPVDTLMKTVFGKEGKKQKN